MEPGKVKLWESYKHDTPLECEKGNFKLQNSGGV
jgi:hypothetical protein